MRIGQANDKSKARVLKMISEATVQKEELIGSKITLCIGKSSKGGLVWSKQELVRSKITSVATVQKMRIGSR